MPEQDILKVRESALPAGLITKGIVTDRKNRTPYVYEDWLRELLNDSKAFMAKTGGEGFSAPIEESHGEADAISSRYEIDFKLVLGQSWLHALRETSRQIVGVGAGVAYTTTGRRQNPMRAAVLHKTLRGMSRERLRTLWDADTNGLSEMAVKDVARFLRTLDKDKNLLLLQPSLLYTDNDAEIDTTVASNAVYSDYREAIDLRATFHPGRETYLAYFLAHRLVVIEVSDAGWSPFDVIPTSASKTLAKLCSYYSPFEYAQLRLLI